MIEDAVRAILMADATVVALATGGIMTPPLPQITNPSAQTPIVSYGRISGGQALTEDGPGTSSARVQIDCWASSYRMARDLAHAVRAALHGFPRAGQHGAQGGELLYLVMQIDQSDANDYDSEVRLHRATADYWIEAAAEAAA